MSAVKLRTVGSSFVENLGCIRPFLNERLDLLDRKGPRLIEIDEAQGRTRDIGSGYWSLVSRHVDGRLTTSVGELADHEGPVSFCTLDSLSEVLDGVES